MMLQKQREEEAERFIKSEAMVETYEDTIFEVSDWTDDTQ